MRMRSIHLPAKTLAHDFHPRNARSRLAAFLVLTALTNTVVFSASLPGSILKLINRFGSPQAIEKFAKTFPTTRTGAKQTSLTSIDVAGVEMAGPSLIVARKGHSATLLSDGRVLLVGGENQNGFVSETEIFDPSSGTFGVSGNLKTPRADHTATRLADGRVLIAAGRGDLGTLSTTEIFDPASGVFSNGPNLNIAREGQTATVVSDGRILVAGGDHSGSIEIYNPSTNSFAPLGASMTSPRAFHGAALLNDGRVLLAGGVAPDGTEVRSGEILNVAVPSFEPVGSSLMEEHVRPTMRVLPDGKVQVNSCHKFSASELRIGLQRSLSGPSQVELRSSVDSYAAAIGSVITPPASPTAVATFTIDLSTVPGLQSRTSAVTFRIYGYNSTGSAGTLRIQRVTSPPMVGLEVDGVVSSLASQLLS